MPTFTRQQVKFIDPKTGSEYEWPANPPPDGIQPSQKQRNITRTSNTGNVGLVKQQGDDGPYVIHWDIFAYTAAHEIALWYWYELSSGQSIYLEDWAGERYEGQIITLSRQQLGALGGPGDIQARGFFVKYAFEFEVWRFVSGPLQFVGVTP